MERERRKMNADCLTHHKQQITSTAEVLHTKGMPNTVPFLSVFHFVFADQETSSYLLPAMKLFLIGLS